MEEFLIKNASAVFALIGALMGTFITGVITYKTKTKEAKLRITEKLLDRKLAAHESLINTVGIIRSMVLLGGEDERGELLRCPLIMESRKNMDDFLAHFNKVQNESDRWLSTKLKKEISFFLDYFVNLNVHSKNGTDEALQSVGAIIRNDFIDIALELENCAHEFFNNDMLKLIYKTDRGWHKYSNDLTIKKLNETEFYKNKSEILKILYGRK